MKVHYINILLFAHALNILVSTNKRNPSITQHTPKIPTTRLLCECELYAPDNYDNYPEMKSVMDNFNKQTQQRFHEYDERMKSKRMQCKDKCDKESQKIILKDKLEKELMDKFATLQTDIENDAIPTCICEKSIADKVEKGHKIWEGLLAPSSGVLAGIAEGALIVWKNAAITSAIDFATKAGIKAGIKAVIDNLIGIHHFSSVTRAMWLTLINSKNYNTLDGLAAAAESALNSIGKPCVPKAERMSMACNAISAEYRGMWFGTAVREGTEATVAKSASVKNAAMGTIEITTTTSTTAIIVSVVVIVVIVLIMIIIYLILKKMKKKLQYIKLLEE
ncbi:rifin PIR protein,putative [Plasmodium sp. DRC-Itaito]|nr:rifin PIR protein,putative [Plasmodium sp. DRC-Itaito]